MPKSRITSASAITEAPSTKIPNSAGATSRAIIIVAKKFIAVTTWRSDDESKSATLAAAMTILFKWVSRVRLVHGLQLTT